MSADKMTEKKKPNKNNVLNPKRQNVKPTE